MTQGVILVAYGKRGYSFAAYNMALSIKYFNPSIQITLFHDDQTLKHLRTTEVFDDFVLLSHEQIYREGVIDPCYLKTRLYDICPYDETLFLDVDGLCLQDLQPLFDKMKDVDYMVDVFDSWTIDKGRDFKNMIWAWCDDIWSHFNLDMNAILPATNSSMQFFRKGVKCKALWDQVKKNYDENKIPLSKLRSHWGGTQPDELYLNAAMAKLGWTQFPRYIFLGDKYPNPPLSLVDITRDYYILSIYGGKGYTKDVYIRWYDRLREKQLKSPYKVHAIISDKHCNTKKKDPTRNEARVVWPPVIHHSVIAIKDTSLIESTKLLQTYKNPKGGDVKVTNWTNCSFIEYKDKIIFVYRMEAQPWCSYTKLGICEMDKSFNPLPETNKLLNLHSDLKGYSKGFHVEDPRLFIHNDQLCLSYCDGYQMGHAVINHETLQATESYYIDKPTRNRTEKNWSFFSHKENLYAVYSVSPHIIFKVDGSRIEKTFTANFPNNWQWGELRGGTSPIKTKEGYLSFFHSSVFLEGNHKQYFMGAYLFDLEPPFAPIAISKEPIIGGEIFPQVIQRLSNKIFVVFPSGVVRRKDCYQVSFGYNDYECRYVEVTDKFLKENMVSIHEHSRV